MELELTACSHPALIGASTLGETTVWCIACRKTVVIPYGTITRDHTDEIAGIIGLAFGSKFIQCAKEVIGE